MPPPTRSTLPFGRTTPDAPPLHRIWGGKGGERIPCGGRPAAHRIHAGTAASRRIPRLHRRCVELRPPPSLCAERRREERCERERGREGEA